MINSPYIKAPYHSKIFAIRFFTNTAPYITLYLVFIFCKQLSYLIVTDSIVVVYCMAL